MSGGMRVTTAIQRLAATLMASAPPGGDPDSTINPQEERCIIVTKDTDFRDLSVLRGFPPRVVWLKIGNCSTADIEHLLRRSHATISAFEAESTTGLLTLIGR